MQVQVSGLVIDGWTFGGTVAYLRIYSSGFTASDGTVVPAGGTASGPYQQITCSAASNTVTCPTFTIQTTTDAQDNQRANYTGVLFDAQGRQRVVVFSGFAVPASVSSPMTYQQLAAYNLAVTPVRDAETYTKTQVNNLLSGKAQAGANGDITSLSALTTPLSVAQGGTNSTTAAAARAALQAAKSGANTDITTTQQTGVLNANSQPVVAYSSTAGSSPSNGVSIESAPARNPAKVSSFGADINPDLLVQAGNLGRLLLGLAQLVWPAADGAAGQALVTDGNKNLSFATVGGAGGGGGTNPLVVSQAAYNATRLRQDSSYNFFLETFLKPPSAPVASLVTDGTGLVTAGAHSFKAAFVDANGNHTEASVASNSVTADASHTKISLSIGVRYGQNLDGNTFAKQIRIYATTAGSSTHRLAATLPLVIPAWPTDQLVYVFNFADSSFSSGAVAPSDNTAVEPRLMITNNGSIGVGNGTTTPVVEDNGAARYFLFTSNQSYTEFGIGGNGSASGGGTGEIAGVHFRDEGVPAGDPRVGAIIVKRGSGVGTGNMSFWTANGSLVQPDVRMTISQAGHVTISNRDPDNNQMLTIWSDSWAGDVSHSGLFLGYDRVGNPLLSFGDTGKIGYYGTSLPQDGQLLIGNTSTSAMDKATLTAGAGIDITNGAGAITIAHKRVKGRATLVAGVVTISEPLVGALSDIFLAAQDNNTAGALRVSARTAGVGFTITSSNAGDSGVVSYWFEL